MVMQACKKGCTDHNALNPTAGAKTDDGSCLYCDSADVKKLFNFTTVWDGQSNSPYFQSTVLQVTTNLFQTAYTGNGCVASGAIDKNSTCTNTRNSLVFFNLTPSTMKFSGTVRVTFSTFPLNFIDYPIGNVTIAPNDSFVIANAGYSCISNQNFFTPNIEVLGPVMQYQ